MSSQCDVSPSSGFDVILKSPRSEAATMVLDIGENTGGPNNKHVGSGQWMYVMDGDGEIIVGEQKYDLHPQRLLLIEAGETHEVRNTGKRPLKTLNIYAPPEYSQ